MDLPTPVGSLDAWLPSPVEAPQATRISPFSTKATSNRSSRWSSRPIAIPGLQSTMAARNVTSQDPADCVGLESIRGAQQLLLGELLDVRVKDATNMFRPREGTVRRGRRLHEPPVCSPSVITGFGVAMCPRQNDTEAPAAEAMSATSLPLPAAHQASPVSLASLCRALSSPIEETGSLAWPGQTQPAAAGACDGGPPTPAEAQQRPSGAAEPALPMSWSAPLAAVSSVPAIEQRGERQGRSDCGSTIPRPPCGVNSFVEEGPAVGPFAEPAPACRGCSFGHGCGGCGLIGRRAAAAAPPLVSCSAKRGLYEGTVRGGSVRNTWRYATCCTAAG